MNSRFGTSFFSVQPHKRRLTREVNVGKVGIGGQNPIRVQSMLTCDTMDTEACIQQTLELVAHGCEIVRITAPTVKDAKNFENIKKGLLAQGCDVPLVADIHFKPDAALEAAKWADKVRINPGNYADSKKFAIREYTDEQYVAELARIRERFIPLIDICKSRGISIRIGTNHGSLSDRIMNRYGDTPLGMVESALEFARIARDENFHQLIFSMKASNPKIMIETYRLLIQRLDQEGPDWNYPIHLGVTEAGDGEDGRIKSSIGIGSMLADGIGDTVRVSLTEDSIHEIPVAHTLIKLIGRTELESNAENLSDTKTDLPYVFDPFSYRRRASEVLSVQGIPVGRTEVPRVVVHQTTFDKLSHKLSSLGDFQPEIILEGADTHLMEVDPRDKHTIQKINKSPTACFVTVKDHLDIAVVSAYRLLSAQLQERHCILLKDTLVPSNESQKEFIHSLIEGAANIGALLCDGIGDAILIQGEEAPGQSLRLAYNILQASGTRIFKTDYVACPSCGRTLFNLQDTTAKIRAATGHLKGVRIAIMGCIVNGPGEMADADFGYVGGAPGKVNLYVGKKAVKFNIPEAEAVNRLTDLIREHNKWVEKVENAAEEPAEV